MTQVNKESLSEHIQHLEDLGSMISINEEYNLKAYKMLLGYVSDCKHAWILNRNAIPANWECEKCKIDMWGEL